MFQKELIMKAIVTTTINPPTEALTKFSQLDDWTLIVIGDLKTPHEAYKKLRCIYLNPEEQSKKYPKVSEILGWKTIQRRNIGFIEAYHLGAEIIATVDDDNIPYANWGTNLLVGKETTVDWWEADEGVFDPLSVTQHSHLWHRGFPLQLVNKRTKKYLWEKIIVPLVQADLWDGDPDVDAIERIAFQPNVTFEQFPPFSTLNITPFNSQNTFLAREVFPYYSVLPHIGRMDDIWGAYMMQKHVGQGRIVFNSATVRQDRNEHDLVKDLEKEWFGIHSLDYILNKYELPDTTKKFIDLYQESFRKA
jgi:hypothetical protein